MYNMANKYSRVGGTPKRGGNKLDKEDDPMKEGDASGDEENESLSNFGDDGINDPLVLDKLLENLPLILCSNYSKSSAKPPTGTRLCSKTKSTKKTQIVDKQPDANAMPWDNAKEAEDTEDNAADNATPSCASKATAATAAAARKARFKQEFSKEDEAPTPTEIEWPIHKRTGSIEITTFIPSGIKKDDVLEEWEDMIAEGLGGLQQLDPAI